MKAYGVLMESRWTKGKGRQSTGKQLKAVQQDQVIRYLLWTSKQQGQETCHGTRDIWSDMV